MDGPALSALKWASWPMVHAAQVMAKRIVQPRKNLLTFNFMK
jgi:hypothetical protein